MSPDAELLAIAKRAQKVFHQRQGMTAPRLRAPVWLPVVYEVLASLRDLGGQEIEDLVQVSLIERAANDPTLPRRLR